MSERKQSTTRLTQYLLEGSAVLLLLTVVVTLGILHFTRPPLQYESQAASQEETVQAEVLAVKDERVTEDESQMVQISQVLELRILGGERAGEEIEVTYQGMGPALRDIHFEPGERAMLMIASRPDGSSYYAVADHVRLWPLGALTVVFAVLTVVVGRWQGLRALLGLALSIALIGGFVLPQLLSDRNPLLVAVVSMAALMAVTLYLIQGWNAISHTALLGLMVSLVVTALLALFWTQVSHLTGFGSEETLYMQSTGVTLDMRGLLLAGTLIGAAGVLDDVILAQVVSVFELARAAPDLGRRALYRRGMKVGNAHLASMVNTLVLAYASAALPLLILFFLYQEPWFLTINRERIAQEIVHTLVGSLGLLLAVPLTTAIAAWVAPQVGALQVNDEPEAALDTPR